MTTMTMKHFDTLGFVKKSKALGASEELAELQARQFEEILEMATSINETHAEELATKKDLKLAIESAKNQIILWVVGWSTGLVLATGFLQHFFK